MGMSGGKGGGGFMPNPLTGAPRGMGIGGQGQFWNGATGGSTTTPVAGAPPPPTNAVSPNTGTGGMAYAGGSNTFDERMGGTPPPTNAGITPPPMMGGNGIDQGGGAMLGAMLKRWNGTSGTVPNPITPPPPQTMGYTPPNANIGQPPPPPPTTGGVIPPTMAAGNFTGQNTSGNSANAINMALATGNQSGLQGAGSMATNSAINAQGAGGGNGWNPQAVSNAYLQSRGAGQGGRPENPIAMAAWMRGDPQYVAMYGPPPK